MGFLKSKKFWLTVAHFGILGGAIAGSIVFPPLIPVIIPSAAAAHGLLPSPFNPVAKPGA